MCPFIHPSIKAKKSFFEKLDGYNENLRKKKNYELWVHGLKNSRTENLPEYLIFYSREAATSLSTDLYGFRGRCLKFFIPAIFGVSITQYLF